MRPGAIAQRARGDRWQFAIAVCSLLPIASPV